MSNDILSKSKLKNKYDINKKINVEDIILNDVSIDDLELGDNNYNQFINLKNLLNSVSSCQISDAFNNLFRKSGVVEGLKSITNLKVYGRITTASTNSDDWGTGIIAINACNKGDILFIKVNNENAAIWGDLASTDAKLHGVGGVAVYGCVRDMEDILHSDYPIFACNFTSNAGKPLGVGNINEDISIDENIIRPGDFFFGDETGVVIVPATLFTQVINEVLSVKLFELNVIKQLKNGRSLMEVVGLNNAIKFK